MHISSILEQLNNAKGAIFDVDGTILDSMEIWHGADYKFLKSRNREPEPDLGKILFPLTMRQCLEYMKEHYELDDTVDEIEQGILDIVTDDYCNYVPFKPGIETIIKTLGNRDIPMTVVTSSERYLIGPAFERLDISHYFNQYFICSELGIKKDKPEIFLRAAESLGANPEEIYVFEDGLYAIEVAKKAGFKIVGIFDNDSIDDQAAIKELSDIYISKEMLESM